MLTAVILICSLVLPASASYNSSLDTSAEIAFLVSLDDGTVIFDKNADKKAAPASLTKIVTAILTIENCADLDTVITIKQSSLDLLKGTDSSTAGLKADEEISIKNLLYCMLVKSANEAAVVLADYIGGGDVNAFVGMMNDLASKLGCENTHFMNPHGLDMDGHYTTARDLAKITQHALTLPVFTEIVNTVTYTLPASNKSGERNLLSTNWMINPNFKTYYYPYAQGIKTGTTSKAGHCVISKASKDGYNYLGIIMNAPKQDVNGDGNPDNCAFLECKKMFKWAFDNLKLTKIADPSQIATVIDIKLSWSVDHVRLVPEKEVTALVPTGTDSTSVMLEVIPEETPTTVNAPVKKGEVIGKARIMYAEQEIATVNLVAAEDIKVNPFKWILHGIKVVFTSVVFRVIFILAVIVLGIYIFSVIRRNQNKKRRRKTKVIKNFRNIK